MDWVFENLQMLIFIGGAIAVWLSKTVAEKNRKQQEAADRETASVLSDEAAADESEERARRLREEIRRRIEERQVEFERMLETEIPDEVEAEEFVPEPPPLVPEVQRVPEPQISPLVEAKSEERRGGKLNIKRLNARGLREAVVLKEILDAPVGLRRDF